MKSTILKIYSDGGSRGNPGPSASAFVIIKDGKIIYKGSKYLGNKTNNESEYYGVVIALEWLLKNISFFSSIEKVLYFLDSELVTRQLIGQYRIKNSNLQSLATKVKNLEKEINKKFSYISIPREKNKIADLLVNKKIDENNG